MSRITLADVARDAGVSRATVSLVLNDNPVVAAATRERVRSSLTRLGYVYNKGAAALRTSRTHAVGLVLTQLTNPYFAGFAEGLQEQCDAQGVDVLLGVSQEEPARQRRILQSMAQRRVDGVVCMPAAGSTAQDLSAGPHPMVLFSRRLDVAGVDYVGADNTKGAYQAANHFFDTHHRKHVAFVGGSARSSARAERLRGMRRAAREHEQATDTPSPTCPLDRAAARRATLRLLQRHPQVDAILALNDVVAFGVVDAVRQARLRIGVDVAVMGFDDIPDAALASPALASVRVDAPEAGRLAARMLTQRLEHPGSPPACVLLPTAVQPRDTCGCGPRKGDGLCDGP